MVTILSGCVGRAGFWLHAPSTHRPTLSNSATPDFNAFPDSRKKYGKQPTGTQVSFLWLGVAIRVAQRGGGFRKVLG